MLSVDIKELQELIEREQAAEEKVKKAKEEAQAVLKEAREKAEAIAQTIELDRNMEKLRQARKEELTQKKVAAEEDHKRKIALVEKTAREDFEKAVSYVTTQVSRVKI